MSMNMLNAIRPFKLSVTCFSVCSDLLGSQWEITRELKKQTQRFRTGRTGSHSHGSGCEGALQAATRLFPGKGPAGCCTCCDCCETLNWWRLIKIMSNITYFISPAKRLEGWRNNCKTSVNCLNANLRTRHRVFHVKCSLMDLKS